MCWSVQRGSRGRCRRAPGRLRGAVTARGEGPVSSPLPSASRPLRGRLQEPAPATWSRTPAPGLGFRAPGAPQARLPPPPRRLRPKPKSGDKKGVPTSFSWASCLQTWERGGQSSLQRVTKGGAVPSPGSCAPHAAAPCVRGAGCVARWLAARCPGVHTEAPRTSVARAADIYRKNGEGVTPDAARVEKQEGCIPQNMLLELEARKAPWVQDP